eukprot:ctg_1112.g356
MPMAARAQGAPSAQSVTVTLPASYRWAGRLRAFREKPRDGSTERALVPLQTESALPPPPPRARVWHMPAGGATTLLRLVLTVLFGLYVAALFVTGALPSWLRRVWQGISSAWVSLERIGVRARTPWEAVSSLYRPEAEGQHRDEDEWENALNMAGTWSASASSGSATDWASGTPTPNGAAVAPWIRLRRVGRALYLLGQHYTIEAALWTYHRWMHVSVRARELLTEMKVRARGAVRKARSWMEARRQQMRQSRRGARRSPSPPAASRSTTPSGPGEAATDAAAGTLAPDELLDRLLDTEEGGEEELNLDIIRARAIERVDRIAADDPLRNTDLMQYATLQAFLEEPTAEAERAYEAATPAERAAAFCKMYDEVEAAVHELLPLLKENDDSDDDDDDVDVGQMMGDGSGDSESPATRHVRRQAVKSVLLDELRQLLWDETEDDPERIYTRETEGSQLYRQHQEERAKRKRERADRRKQQRQQRRQRQRQQAADPVAVSSTSAMVPKTAVPAPTPTSVASQPTAPNATRSTRVDDELRRLQAQLDTMDDRQLWREGRRTPGRRGGGGADPHERRAEQRALPAVAVDTAVVETAARSVYLTPSGGVSRKGAELLNG